MARVKWRALTIWLVETGNGNENMRILKACLLVTTLLTSMIASSAFAGDQLRSDSYSATVSPNGPTFSFQVKVNGTSLCYSQGGITFELTWNSATGKYIGTAGVGPDVYTVSFEDNGSMVGGMFEMTKNGNIIATGSYLQT